MEHVQQLKNVFAYYTGHNDMWRILCAQLVDTGKISRYDLLRVFSPNTDIENIAPCDACVDLCCDGKDQQTAQSTRIFLRLTRVS